MKDKVTVAEVNCEDHKALCLQEKVQGYPMIILCALVDSALFLTDDSVVTSMVAVSTIQVGEHWIPWRPLPLLH